MCGIEADFETNHHPDQIKVMAAVFCPLGMSVDVDSLSMFCFRQQLSRLALSQQLNRSPGGPDPTDDGSRSVMR